MNFIHTNPPPKGAILALGVFDGVHQGHQRLMKTAVAQAQKCTPQHCPTGAISFWPHPQSVFAPERPVMQLTSPLEQAAIVETLGLDYFGFFHFTKEFASLSAWDFAHNVLVNQLGVKGVVIGFNFRYGRHNEGNFQTLQEAGSKMGFAVRVCEAVRHGGEVISSTRIRKTLSDGNVETAITLLGRPYFVTGVVTHGYGRGKGLGFPTANLELPVGRMIPAAGVYSGRVLLADGKWYTAAIFVGPRLTFNDLNQSIEVYILDWDGELYGTEVRVEFLHRIRGIVKFDSSNELAVQVGKDVEQVRQFAVTK